MTFSADGIAHLELVPTTLGSMSLLSSMIHLTNGQTPTALLDLEVTAPDAIVVRGFDRNLASPRPLSSIVSRNPLIQLDAQMRNGEAAVAFASSQFVVNDRPVKIEGRRAVFELRVAFPAAIEPSCCAFATPLWNTRSLGPITLNGWPRKASEANSLPSLPSTNLWAWSPVSWFFDASHIPLPSVFELTARRCFYSIIEASAGRAAWSARACEEAVPRRA
jgi:hypothetical protein